MARVDVCPENLTTITKASKRLGCDKDEYGNDQYICLPTVDMSSLVEFCYKGIMGYNKKGNCLQASKGNLTLIPCVGFLSGCPKTSFKSSDFYKYSACQSLDLEHHCYKTDPKCPQNTDKMSETQAGFIGVIAVIPIVVLFVLFVLAYIYLRKRRKQRKTKKIAGDYIETTNEDDQEMHNFPSEEHPDRPFLNKGAEKELTDTTQHSEMESDELVEKCVKKNEKLRSSMDRLIEDTLQEMEKLFPGKEAPNEVKSAVLRVKKCIDIDAKTNDVFTNLIVVSKLFTMFTNNPNLSTFELKATRSFLSKIFKTTQFSFENIKKSSEEHRKYSIWSDDTDDVWSRAAGHEDCLIQRNRELTNIGNIAPKHEKEVLENNNCERKVGDFLSELKSKVEELIIKSEVIFVRRSTAYIDLFFRIAILHSFVLWQTFFIKRRSASNQLSTALSEIKKCQDSNLSMLQYISNPRVEHAVFLSVCHLTDNENIRNFFEIQDIKPFVLRESFYGRKHYIQWGKSPNVKLQMQSFSYKVSGTYAVTDKCEFYFISVNGREMDNIYYIRSARWEDYYIGMSENGSCDAVNNKHEKGVKWKFVPLGINLEHPMFIISSIDWPGNFLCLESDGLSVKGESHFENFKVNGLWKICDVERESETPGLNSANV
nr:uncharacterized protein LOC111104108 isoform X2 [Crassostrea virginica]